MPTLCTRPICSTPKKKKQLYQLTEVLWKCHWICLRWKLMCNFTQMFKCFCRNLRAWLIAMYLTAVGKCTTKPVQCASQGKASGNQKGKMKELKTCYKSLVFVKTAELVSFSRQSVWWTLDGSQTLPLCMLTVHLFCTKTEFDTFWDTDKGTHTNW